MSVAEFSIKRPVTAVMFFISLFVIGLIAAIRLPLEAFPEVSPPFIFVSLPYTGSTPEEVERTVLRPAEEALSTMAGIKRMESNAKAEGAQIFIQFSNWDRDVAIAALQQLAQMLRDQRRQPVGGTLAHHFAPRPVEQIGLQHVDLGRENVFARQQARHGAAFPGDAQIGRDGEFRIGRFGIALQAGGHVLTQDAQGRAHHGALVAMACRHIGHEAKSVNASEELALGVDFAVIGVDRGHEVLLILQSSHQ